MMRSADRANFESEYLCAGEGELTGAEVVMVEDELGLAGVAAVSAEQPPKTRANTAPKGMIQRVLMEPSPPARSRHFRDV